MERGVEGLAAAAHGDFGVWKHHLDEAATLLLLDQYEEAAYRYFVLANDPVAAGHAERREALFYEGESLFLLRSWRAALPCYVELAAGEGDASYKQEAFVRLVEIASAIGDDAGVDRAWDRFVAQAPGATVEPQVAYALAKSYYRRGDLVRADDVFAKIDPAGSRGLPSRYFRAVIALRRGDRAQAAAIFAELAALSGEGRERGRIANLSRLSLARLRYAAKDYPGAIEAYAQVAEQAPERADSVYEKAWAELKSGNARAADDDLDLFLIAFPEHPLAPRVKLLRGKLALALARDDDARESFRSFTATYAPVLAKVDEVRSSTNDPAQLLAKLNAPEGERGFNRALPAAAAQAALARPSLRRALSLMREMADEDGSLSDGRALAALLAEGLEEASVAGLPEANERRRLAWSLDLRAQRARFELLDRAARSQAGSAPVAAIDAGGAAGTAADAARARVLSLLEAIPAAQRAQSQAADDQRARISLLRAEVGSARESIEQARATAIAVGKYLHDTASTADAARDPILGKASQESVTKELGELAARERDLLRVSRELDVREAATRAAVLSPREAAARRDLDAAVDEYQARVGGALTPDDAQLLARLVAARAQIATALVAIGTDEKARLGEASARLAEENRALTAESVALSAARGRVITLAGAAARAGLAEVSASLDALLLRADLGVLDVAWTQKIRQTQAIDALARQRDAELEAVDRKFKDLLPPAPEEEKR